VRFAGSNYRHHLHRLYVSARVNTAAVPGAPAVAIAIASHNFPWYHYTILWLDI
jgi:hypothetical protein